MVDSSGPWLASRPQPMESAGYFSPFVPPEWIAAHGLRPVWVRLDRSASRPFGAAHRGVCPCAAALVAGAMGGGFQGALVLTTVCDQMRYASAYLESESAVPGFLMNVPSTWQNSQSRSLYRGELERLGHFLARIGGSRPANRQIIEAAERYDDRRREALASRRQMSARQWARTLASLRSDLAMASPAEAEQGPGGGVPLLLLGGPLLAEDDSFLELVEGAGGRIVVDGSETGERTLPAPLDRRRLAEDPLDELARIYFDAIPDAFRRPNTRLYEWLGREVSARSVRGIILRRYPFCDLWHAELHRLRTWSDVPVLDLDVETGDEGEASRTLARIEAFLEMLR